VTQLSTPFWSAAALLLALLSYPALRKWRRDRAALGQVTFTSRSCGKINIGAVMRNTTTLFLAL
jgi:hypothetical protein